MDLIATTKLRGGVEGMTETVEVKGMVTTRASLMQMKKILDEMTHEPGTDPMVTMSHARVLIVGRDVMVEETKTCMREGGVTSVARVMAVAIDGDNVIATEMSNAIEITKGEMTGTKGIAGEMTGTKGIIIAEIVAVAIGIVMIVTVANVVGEMVCRVNLGISPF